jgi:hypothetical protein
MSPSLIGGLVGLAFAVVEYFVFGAVIERAGRRGETGQGPRILDLVRKGQLIAFPLIGFFVGPVLADSFGAF